MKILKEVTTGVFYNVNSCEDGTLFINPKYRSFAVVETILNSQGTDYEKVFVLSDDFTLATKSIVVSKSIGSNFKLVDDKIKQVKIFNSNKFKWVDLSKIKIDKSYELTKALVKDSKVKYNTDGIYAIIEASEFIDGKVDIEVENPPSFELDLEE